MPKLAIKGGKKVREALFPAYNTIDDHEINAVVAVMRKGKLSQFLGCWEPDFYGGKQIQAMEQEYAQYFGVKHAISVNSNTSGLMCALGAAGIGPGDEVIVSPYTMSASASSVLLFNAIPVFADIEPDYFCIDPVSVEKNITPHTKAILAVDILGMPYNVEAINAIAKKHNLLVIEDAAQAPGAFYRNRPAGTLADVGIFSLNYHKHIHSGEGGVIVTDNDELADRMRLIRNHAEAVVEAKGNTNLNNMLGFNFRMTEIEAAIASEQLKKLKGLVEKRIENSQYIIEKLSQIPAIKHGGTRPYATHVYYQQAFLFDSQIAEGVHRNTFIEAVAAELPASELREHEGARIEYGYVRPLYLQPLYQNKILYGGTSCPFVCGHANKNQLKYDKGTCPTAEKLHFDTLFTHELMHSSMNRQDLDHVVEAFYKVYDNLAELK